MNRPFIDLDPPFRFKNETLPLLVNRFRGIGDPESAAICIFFWRDALRRVRLGMTVLFSATTKRGPPLKRHFRTLVASPYSKLTSLSPRR